MDPNEWGAAWVVAVIAIFSFFLARHQLSQLNKSRRFETLYKHFEKISTSEARDRVSTLYKIKNIESIHENSKCDLKLKEIIEEIASSLNEIGYVVTQKIVDEKDICELYAVRIIRCWHQLRFYVRAKRKNEAGNHAEYFEKLAEKCLDWWLRKPDINEISIRSHDFSKSMTGDV